MSIKNLTAKSPIADKTILQNPLFWIFIVSPFILLGLITLLPTFDDWTYLTTPYAFDKEESFFYQLRPHDSYWRPFDALFGYVLSFVPSWFPALNHIAIYGAHLGSTILIYRFCKLLDFERLPQNIATVFFFLSPATLGTVLSVDGLNQTYAQFWGLAATYTYMKGGRWHTPLWLMMTVFALLSKENGIAFMAIAPALAWAFRKSDGRRCMKDFGWAVLVAAVYVALRLTLQLDNFIHPAYLDHSIGRVTKNICVFLGMSWMPIDYAALIHPLHRDYLLVAITFCLTMPFMLRVYLPGMKHLRQRQVLGLLFAVVAAASFHLVTMFTMMHPYSSLGMLALLTGYLIQIMGNRKWVAPLFGLFIISSVFTDLHHWYASYLSGKMGEDMTLQTIRKSKLHPKSVYLINVDRGETKYSSFWVIPYDSFGWGIGVQFHNRFEWPKEICDTIIYDDSQAAIRQTMNCPEAKKYQAVWYVHGDTVDVIKQGGSKIK